jgi:hypothetical protein
MRRKLLTFAAAVSLLLCVTVCVLWGRSYRAYDFVLLYENRAPTHEAFGWAYTSEGTFILHWETIEGDSRRPPQPRWSTVRRYKNSGGVVSRWLKANSGRHAIGFWLVTEQHQYTGLPPAHSSSLGIPYWFLVTATAALPVGWIIRRVRSCRRVAAMRCLNCGYDLRATPDR